MLLYVLDVVLLLMELGVGVEDVGDGVTHGVSSELHDVTGDLMDPITSYASSLLYATPPSVVCGLTLLVVLSIIGITPKPSLRTRSP